MWNYELNFWLLLRLFISILYAFPTQHKSEIFCKRRYSAGNLKISQVFWVEEKTMRKKMETSNPQSTLETRKAQRNVYNSFVNQNFVFSEKKRFFLPRRRNKLLVHYQHFSSHDSKFKMRWCDAFGVKISKKLEENENTAKKNKINLWKGSLKSWFILQKVTLNK